MFTQGLRMLTQRPGMFTQGLRMLTQRPGMFTQGLRMLTQQPGKFSLPKPVWLIFKRCLQQWLIQDVHFIIFPRAENEQDKMNRLLPLYFYPHISSHMATYFWKFEEFEIFKVGILGLKSVAGDHRQVFAGDRSALPGILTATKAVPSVKSSTGLILMMGWSGK
jgi:hypothetical protein